MPDRASRLADRIQLATDGHNTYIDAIRVAFGFRIDCAQLVKDFGRPEVPEDRRYSATWVRRMYERGMTGDPDMHPASTSIVERSNLTLRTTVRRFIRLTNAFRKKAENHAHAVSIEFMSYNFCTLHGTLTTRAKGLPTTPAMAAGLDDRVSMPDVAERMDEIGEIVN